MKKKRIGFVDYCLDNFHANVYLSALRGPLARRGFVVAGATAILEEPSQKWANEQDVAYFDSVAELARNVDYFIVLAPSNPEVHLELCQQVFSHGKTTFIDKTFAPDLLTAEEIFALADSQGIAIQSTSALRTTNIQHHLARSNIALQSMFISAAGPTFEEYGIHPLELAISCLGPNVASVTKLGCFEHPQFLLQYGDGRTALIDFNIKADLPFCATLITSGGCEHLVVDTENLFVDAAANILDFFEADKAQIDRRETLMVRHLLDLIATSEATNQVMETTVFSSEKAPLNPPHWRKDSAEKLASQAATKH